MRVDQNKIRIEMPTEDLLEEVVDVSAGLSDPTRILYPKVAKKAQFMDDFLASRLQLKSHRISRLR